MGKKKEEKKESQSDPIRIEDDTGRHQKVTVWQTQDSK